MDSPGQAALGGDWLPLRRGPPPLPVLQVRLLPTLQGTPFPSSLLFSLNPPLLLSQCLQAVKSNGVLYAHVHVFKAGTSNDPSSPLFRSNSIIQEDFGEHSPFLPFSLSPG